MRRWMIAAAVVAALAILVMVFVPKNPSPEGFDGAVFSTVDEQGRAGVAMAVLSRETLDSQRDRISGFIPSGYSTIPMDDVPGGYLFNRCHLIAARLAFGTEVGENLVTGTRQMNSAMEAVESQVADYLKATGKHVLYRVEPDFQGDELICRGVSIRAWSIEDDGMRLDVYLDNVQDGVSIDYLAGTTDAPAVEDVEGDWILNIKSHRFHRPDCAGAKDIKPDNRQDFHGLRSALIEQGFRPCGSCKP